MPSDDRLPVTYVMPSPVALQTPASAEAWVGSLPPEARQQFIDDVKAVVLSQPPAIRAALARYLVQVGQRVPNELSTGLGDAAASGTDAGWGALAGALIGAGAGLYANSQSIKANNALAASAAATDTNIAAINAAGNIAINQAFANAQSTAAAIKAQTTVSIAPTIAKWSAIGAVGIAAAGFGIWYLMRRRKS